MPTDAARPTPFSIDAGADVAAGPHETEAAARIAEEQGYDGFVVSETKHDPFVGLALAARATHGIRLASGIAVAFARSPMTTAVLANDLQLASEGRFELGLGSQVQPHIERRFSMPWSAPAKRMREYVSAIRAIQHSWRTGDRLQFRGEYYQHTLMTPFFDPGPNPHGEPPVWLAAVGERMTEVAGEVADGLIAHSFTTARYLTEVSLPALARGRSASGRPGTTGVSLPAFVVLGDTPAALAAAERATRRQIAFYGSTPTYRGVLDLHGWGEVADQMHAGSRRGEWDAIAELVDDDMLDAFAVSGTAAEVATRLHDRFDGLATRLAFNAPYPVEPGVWRELLSRIRA